MYHREEFQAYSSSQRLDKFFYDLLAGKQKYSVLWKVVRMVLILSHGQSDVERGFSVNKDILACNMGEDTVFAFRTVHDGVKHMGCKVHEVPVTKAMLQSCRHSRQRYTAFLEEQKKNKKANEAEDRRKQMSELKECKKTEQRLDSEAVSLFDKADKLSEQAESTHKWELVIEANALRTKAKQKRKELEETKKHTEIVEKKLKL